MIDLTTLLDRAAGPAATRMDPTADLTRGHRALARRRVRRGAAGLAGVAAVGAIGVGLTTHGGDGGTTVATDPTPTASVAPAPTTTPSPEVHGVFAYTTRPPAGWELQGTDPATAVWARPGDTTPRNDFEGKVVVSLETNRPAGEPRTVEGRTFWVAPDTGGGYTRVSTRTRDGEPEGVLSVQFPASIAWPTDDVIAFLNGVRVLGEAQPEAG